LLLGVLALGGAMVALILSPPDRAAAGGGGLYRLVLAHHGVFWLFLFGMLVFASEVVFPSGDSHPRLQ